MGETTKFWRWGSSSSGAFVDTEAETHNVVAGTGSAKFVGVTFDASRCSNIYDSNATAVLPRRLQVLHCIKYI